ncbi:MAG: hypothetical protein AAF610_10175 [Pseudomonadota bacterium]
MRHLINRRAVLAACVAAALGNSVSVSAQSGPTTRPINMTCVAPDRPTLRLSLRPVEGQEATATLRAGPEHGLLYRGAEAGWLQGSYLFVSQDGEHLMAREAAGHTMIDQVVYAPDVRLLGLSEGRDGEILLATSAGWQQLVGEQTAAANFPATLSATGCVDANDASVPASGLIPYEPSAPLWTDGASKRRWIAMPDWREADSQITVEADGDFDFPIGTVLVKEFAIGSFRVETRLFVRHEDGNWAGYSYEWNDAQTDADLLPGFKQKDVLGQTWTFPSRSQCLFCHSAAAGRSLGLEIAQLNNELDYGADGVGNQLTVLDQIGLVDGGLPGPVATLDALPDYASSAPVAERARGYLHSNCAMCHQPGGPGGGPEDFRYALTGAEINALDVIPTRGDLGVAGALLLKRGLPEESVLWLRLASDGFGRMPPIGVSIVHSEGVDLIGQWIETGSGFGFTDSDGDEFSDDLDNCSAVANKDQRDTDGDGFGNRCDADLNNDGIVNIVDLGVFRQRFFTNDADADFNGDNIVNVLDLGVLRASFFMPPGPGALTP